MKGFYSFVLLLMAVANPTAAFGLVQADRSSCEAAADIAGAYKCEYSAPEGYYVSANVDIESSGADKTLLTFYPWTDRYMSTGLSSIVARVNPSESTFTISADDNKDVGTYPDLVGCYQISVIVSEYDESQKQYILTDKVVGSINDDGSIVFPPTSRICFAFLDKSDVEGYMAIFDGLRFVRPDYFTFKNPDWEFYGNAEFDDRNTNLIFKPEIQVEPVSVKMYQNKENKSLYCVENPYAQGGWAMLNADPNAQGYIVFSLENPDFVWMRPLTPSGLWMDLFGEGLPVDLYMYNFEGDYVFNQGMSVEDAAAKFAAANIVPSSYDSKTRVVKLLNNIFACSTEPFGTYSWTDIDGVLEFTMPDPSGVDGIYNDTENVAKRYFNLQGVEIANPEAGQIVIVKEGNKTSKAIVR